MRSVQKTKKPIGIYIVGFIFILSPIGNIIFSLFTSGDINWFHLQNVRTYIESIYWLDWVWLSSLTLTGALLLKSHRASWAMAIVTLSFIVGLNVYRFFAPPFGHEGYSDLYMIASFLATATLWVLAFYFRYPYVDRRSQWLVAPADRYDNRTAVQVVANDIFDGVTESISISGARIHLQRDLGDSQKKMRYVDVIFPALQNIKITCEVIECIGNSMRVRYKKLPRKNRAILMAWLKSQDEIN